MRAVCEKPAVHLIINAEAFEIRHTHRNSINAGLKVSRGFCRGRTAYLEELRVILINSVGGRDDGAAHRRLQDRALHDASVVPVSHFSISFSRPVVYDAVLPSPFYSYALIKMARPFNGPRASIARVRDAPL